MNHKNLIKCDKCNLMLISEESISHECRKVNDYCIIDGQIWLGDGTKYYPINRKLTVEEINRRLDRTPKQIL